MENDFNKMVKDKNIYTNNQWVNKNKKDDDNL